MFVFFGLNNFLIKRFKPSDLQIELGDESGETFEVRQHYMHLFFIPCFAIGKQYIMRRKNDKDLYAMPDPVMLLILDKYPVRTPWYTFSGLIIALLVFGGFQFKHYKRKWAAQNEFHAEVAQRKDYIRRPTAGDYYEFSLTDKNGNYQGNEGHDHVYLKVQQYSTDSINFISLYPDLVGEYQHISGAVELFDSAAQHAYHPLAISKQTLLAGVDSLYDDAQKPVYIDAFQYYCRISDLDRRPLPGSQHASP